MGEPRDTRLYLIDILDSINLIKEYVAGMDEEAFASDQYAQDAVSRRLEIIAEASKFIPEDLKKLHSNIPWRSIVSMRNMVVHEYFGVQWIHVWRTANSDLDDLKRAVDRMLEAKQGS